MDIRINTVYRVEVALLLEVTNRSEFCVNDEKHLRRFDTVLMKRGLIPDLPARRLRWAGCPGGKHAAQTPSS